MVLLSGGIDSATCAYLCAGKYETRAITFAFHGIARAEIRAAREIGRAAGVREHRLVRLPDLREAQDMEARFDGFPLTYIPLRNAIFYSFAASYAEEAGARYLVGGHNRGDPRTFRDAGGAFLGNMERALRSGSAALDEGGLRILRPLERMTKPQVVRLAARVGVPFQLTWSCHSEGPRHCWRCGGCRTRVEAFRKAGVADPLRTRIPRKVS